MINTDGNVGIGTGSPDQVLTVRPAQEGKYGIHVIKPSTTNDSLGGIFVETDGTSSLYLKIEKIPLTTQQYRLKSRGDTYFVGGNVGIGTRTPKRALEVQCEAANGIVLRGITCSGSTDVLDIRKTDTG